MRRLWLLILCLILTACRQVNSSPSPAVTLTPPEIFDPALYPTTTADHVLEIARSMLPRVEVDLGQPAMLGAPLPVFWLSGQALRAYRPETPVASMLTPGPEWVMPVLLQGEGRQAMSVGFSEGVWQVVGFGGQEVQGRNLALLQQQYDDRYDAIMLISVYEVGHHLALVREGEREVMIFVSDGSYLFPELRENFLQALPPERVMAKLLEALPNCDPGMAC